MMIVQNIFKVIYKEIFTLITNKNLYLYKIILKYIKSLDIIIYLTNKYIHKKLNLKMLVYWKIEIISKYWEL